MTTYASSIDLRPFARQVLDQGPYSECVENALSAAIDLQMREAGHPVAPISRMQSYADTRTGQGTFNVDTGSIPEVTLNNAMSKGLAYESSWPYDGSLLYQQPTAAVYAEAAQHKVLSWSALNIYQSWTGLRDTVKEALDEGKPVILSFHPHQFFFDEGRPLNEQINHGYDTINLGHAVIITGTDDLLNYGGSDVVKNSWAVAWGDGGYGTISYTQFAPHPGTTNMDLMGLYVLNGFDGLDFTYTPAKTTVSQEYACLLGRAADIGGLTWFASQVSNGTSGATIGDYLIASSEGTAIYGLESNAQFVEAMYHNILGRASDSGGLSFWTGVLNNGSSRGTVANYLLNAINDPSAEQPAHDFLAQKTSLANYITIARQYDGSHNAAVSAEIASVTPDPNHTEIIKIGISHDWGLA